MIRTLHCCPKDCEFSVTKIALAAEELYDRCLERKKKKHTVKTK